MTFQRPSFRHPGLLKNQKGFSLSDYEGTISTLCAGCGHDSISGAIVHACYELNIEPHRLAKLSGIGCSSKTPTYFLSNSHGFNTVHGRMPSVATGAYLANRDLIYLGVSGDGDSASIGMGQFVHAIRKNLNVLYIVMNNGCYGLTKGQDSATADKGSISKAGIPTPFETIDLAGLALELGATFVARSFSGDKEQLIPLLKLGMNHSGFALLDIISPCVTFNNTAKSTKSYSYVREHMEMTGTLDFVPMREEITTRHKSGSTKEITMHDGSDIMIHKISSDWDPTNRWATLAYLHQAQEKGEILTGLMYVDPQSKELHELLNTTHKPLNRLTEAELNPGEKVLEQINASYR